MMGEQRVFDMVGTYSVGSDSTPSALLACDLDGDAILDLVALTTNGVSILMGNGDGTFEAAKHYCTFFGQEAGLAAGDFNNDGVIDLMVAHYYGKRLSVIPGMGDGTFEDAYVYPAPSYQTSVAIADFDANTILDAAVANEDGFVSMLLGNGDRTFRHGDRYEVGVNPICVVSGDVNQDDLPDLVVANQGAINDSSISVLINNGDGSFRVGAPHIVGGRLRCIALHDVTKSGTLDIVMLDEERNAVRVLRDGIRDTLQETIDSPLSTKPESIAFGDFDGDGKEDIVVSRVHGMIGLLIGNGDGTFGSSIDQVVGGRPVSIVAGDFDGDGRLDIAVLDIIGDSVSILLNRL